MKISDLKMELALEQERSKKLVTAIENILAEIPRKPSLPITYRIKELAESAITAHGIPQTTENES